MAPSDTVVATVVFLTVTASFPFFLYGAWIILDNDPVTWSVLSRHLTYILTGLALTTIPILAWMGPRLFGLGPHTNQFGGFAFLHAFLGLQAYALLAFGFTGIARIFRAKYEHDLYADYDEDVLLDEIGDENMGFWRRRLRIGVFGYTVFWLLAWVTGVTRYVLRYALTG